MNKWLFTAMATLLLIGGTGCTLKTSEEPTPSTEFNIDFEKYTLANGLELVLHVDKSDPIVAINLAAHVGSARETAGKTGFAHLFEHLLFMDSENLGYGGLDEMNTRIGGEGTNGFTTHDMTQYFQAVPSDALEKIIWAEADKLGYFINTVTENIVANEKQVVKNEKRLRVDNRPYGHSWYIVNKTLYPEDHPYNWQVIGSLKDLDSARLADVKEFYKRWYVPNNVTVTISGDFDPAKAKILVEKYFGKIPKGENVEPFAPRAGVLTENKSLFHEDNFAKVAQLSMVWPTVEQYHKDSYALDILSLYLSEGKRAPLNEVLIDEEKLTSNVEMFQYGKEIAGEMYLVINANPNEDLDAIPSSITSALKRFESKGISTGDLDRIKAGLEVTFYKQIQSALGKAIQLGEYNLFTDDPGFIKEDINRRNAVTTEDVMRVYNTYIKNKHYIASSFVPKGKLALALDGAVKADIVEEKVVKEAEKEIDFDPTARTFTPTSSSFDRTIEPAFGDPYTLLSPTVWRDQYSNGMDIFGIESSETPLVFFSLAIEAGQEKGNADKPAVPKLTADLLQKGTASKTTSELEDAIKALGSHIDIVTTQYGTYVEGNTLSRNFNATITLVTEMLLEPRWDAKEFEILMRSKRNELEQAAGDPNIIAQREAAKLRYSKDHIFHYQPYGTKEKLATVNLNDLKAFYLSHYKPTRAKLRVVGDIKKDTVNSNLKNLVDNWKGKNNVYRPLPLAKTIETSEVFFYDIPGSKQSVLNLSRPSLKAIDTDLPVAKAMNFLLGGIYTSALMTELRVNKGYTYSIRSSFQPSLDRGLFSVRSSVRSNVTKESIELIRSIVSNYGPSFTEENLATLKSALLRGQALKNETLTDKLNMLSKISEFEYADDYAAKHLKEVEAMTLPQLKALAKKYLRPNAWNYVVVGDAKTQAEGLKALGYGDPVMLNDK